MIKIHTFTFNPIQENTFVVYDDISGDCIIVDPGCWNDSEFEQLKGFISAYDLKPQYVVNTHGHFDHILGVDRCRKEWNIKWKAHPGDSFLIDAAPAKGAMFGFPVDPINQIDIELDAGVVVEVGSEKLLTIHVPGHSPGSLCLYSEKFQLLIVGDVLFRGSIGRTDLEQGDHDLLLTGIKEKLLVLPENTTVYSGHGPSTTIAYEKANNPFLQ